MKDKAPEPPIFISNDYIMVVVIIIVVLSSAFIIFMMLRDYYMYLQDHSRKKCRFVDFIEQEQFYIYLLLFFCFLATTDLWIQYLQW